MFMSATGSSQDIYTYRHGGRLWGGWGCAPGNVPLDRVLSRAQSQRFCRSCMPRAQAGHKLRRTRAKSKPNLGGVPRARDPCHAACIINQSTPWSLTHRHSLITPDERDLAAGLLVVLGLVTQAQGLHLAYVLVLMVSL